MVDRVGQFPAGFMTAGNRAKFEIQDPFGVREVVQPIVSVSRVEDKITGLGTCFQISPWTWLTAQHVLMDNPERFFPENEVGAVGFSPGLVYGRVGFSAPDYFAPITEIHMAVAKEHAEKRDKPSFSEGMHVDLATIKLDKSKLKRRALTSPLPIAKVPPKIGDEIFGVGFPILDSRMSHTEAKMIFTERMFGAGGVVTELHPNGLASSRPWPTFQVEGDWASGMSGGPVVNMSGEVVGVISSSVAPTDDYPGVGFAVSLSEIPVSWFAPEIDPSNPGWSRGFGVFQKEQMIGFFETWDEAHQYASSRANCAIKKAACHPQSESWVEL